MQAIRIASTIAGFILHAFSTCNMFYTKKWKKRKKEKSGKKRNCGKKAEKKEKSGNFPQKAEEVATLVLFWGIY